MKFNCYYFLTVVSLLLFTAAPVQAQNNENLENINSEDELIVYIENLKDTPVTNISSLITQYEYARTLAQTKEWRYAYLVASLYKLWQVHSLGEISKAQQIYEETMPLAYELEAYDIVIPLAVFNVRMKSDVGDYTDMDIALNELVEMAQHNAEYEDIAGSIYLEVGRVYTEMAEYESALFFLEQAYTLYENIEDTYHVAYVLDSLASVSMDLNDYEQAIQYFENALEIATQFDDPIFESTLFHNKGLTHFYNKQNELALQAYTKALQINEDLGDKIGIAWVKVSISEVSTSMGDWSTTEQTLAQALPIFVEAGNVFQQLNIMLEQVDAYLHLGKLVKAQDSLNKIELLLKEIDDEQFLVTFLKHKSTLKYQKGQYKQAYAFLEEHAELQTRLYDEKDIEASQKYKTLFDTKLKDDQNKKLQLDNEVKNIKIAQQQAQEKIWMIVIVLSAILILVIVVLLVLQTRNRNRFKALALCDHLTNSPNRRAVLKYAQDRFEYAKARNEQLIIAIVDLDYFKQLNDNFGHDTGDRVLINFSKACHQEIRHQDGFGRYGGEEWLFVFRDTGKDTIFEIFHRIRNTLNSIPCEGLPENHSIYFSMGAAQYTPNVDDNLNTLIKRADEKLYEAKENGRNQCQI